MTELKELAKDPDGLATYDYIVNHMPQCVADMDFLTENLIEKDNSGRFLASSARFLKSLDPEAFNRWVYRLVEGAIQKDRERRYIGGLLEALWGSDYKDRAEELSETDDNFRRIYKRIYPGDKV